MIDYFKSWLPIATHTLKVCWNKMRRKEAEKKEQLRREREAEEQRLRVRRNIKI